MKITTLCVAAALTILPAMSFAMCSYSKQHQAQTCATGTVWDAESQRCVEQVSS